MRWDFVLFFASVVMLFLGDWALYIGVAGLVLSVLHGTLKSVPTRRARKMVVAIGLVASAVAFVGLAAFYLRPSWFGLSPISTSTQSDERPIARLAELGWTVRPGAKEIVFEISNGSLPAMAESAKYFKQLSKPFRLHFQQVTNLDGLHFLAGVEGCTKIEINAGEFTDLSELRDFHNLPSLIVSQLPLNGSGTVDIAPLAKLTNLRELNLGSVKLRTIEPLSELKNLRSLYLRGTFITDVSAASAFSALESIDLTDTRVTDLSPLSHLQELSELGVGGAQLPGLPALRNLKKLKTLRVIEQGPIEFSPIAELTNLESVWIWGGRFPLNVLPIRNLTKLRYLALSGLGFGPLTQVTNIEVVGTLRQLQTLTLGQLQIGDLTFVESLNDLTEINLGDIPITSVAPLRGLKKLKKISLTSTMVVDISPFMELPALTDLTVGRTPARTDVLSELERRGVNVRSF